jgi:hypothetical protein
MLGEAVAIKGNGAEHVGGVEGAVDRIADEILRRLEKGRTLVVWAFDASGSLQAERQRLSKHIETVYTHIKQLDEKELAGDDGLLTVVVSFGRDRTALTPAPTADPAAIISAIDSVPLDTSGVESTFQTVLEISRRWGRYRDDEGHAYHPMIIVVTDEVGDDEPRLGEAIAAAKAAKAPVYVLGSQALFGRVDGYMTTPTRGPSRLTEPPRPPGPRERGAGADPPAVLVRRPAVRGPRRGLRPLRPEPAGRRDRRRLLRDADGPRPHLVRPGPDARIQARLGRQGPVSRRASSGIRSARP